MLCWLLAVRSSTVCPLNRVAPSGGAGSVPRLRWPPLSSRAPPYPAADLPFTKFVSVPREMGHLNPAAFVAGIVRGALDGAGFSAR